MTPGAVTPGAVTPSRMAERLVLDTSVLVDAERGRLDLAQAAGDDADAALPAIVVAEYLTGVHLARTEAQRDGRQAFLDRVLSLLPVITYDRQVAEHHARLLAHVRAHGETRGAHDLIIAATAAARSRTVLTADARAQFDSLPGVASRLVASPAC